MEVRDATVEKVRVEPAHMRVSAPVYGKCVCVQVKALETEKSHLQRALEGFKSLRTE